MCFGERRARSAVGRRQSVFESVSSEQLAEQWKLYNTSISSNNTSMARTNELCPTPHHLCHPDSAKAEDFCEHGVCCVILNEEHCSCEKGFAGARCDETFLEGYLNRSTSMSRFVEAVSAISVITVIVVIILIILLILFYLRARHRRLEQHRIADEEQTKAKITVRAVTVAEPGFSWREVSVKRHKSVSRSPSDNSRVLSMSASDITALDTTPLTPLAPLGSPLASPNKRNTQSGQQTYTKLHN